MAADGPGGEKTEQPTQKRLTEARNNGDLLQSRELSTALVVMAGVAWLAFTGPDFVAALQKMLSEGLRFSYADINDFSPGQRIAHLMGTIAMPLAGILCVTLIAAFAAPAVLGSLGFRTGALTPKFSKLNPATGLKRLASPQSLVELGKSIAKILLIGAIGGTLIWQRMSAIETMGKTGIQPAIAEVGTIFILVALALAGSLFIVAGIDVPAQIMARSKRLNMTKQEVKDEHKESEGSPEAKGAIRRKQHEIARGSVRKAVEEASVVITNPTHFAVALRYHPGRDHAPIVVARGADEIAAVIRELAHEKSLPVLQYPALTRAVYYTSRAGEPIDERLFMAVAMVLAFVFRLENRMATEMDRPHIDLPDSMNFDADGNNIVN